jgi:hypothetical protein
MARALSVKVPTASLIALVEQKIADLKLAIANYPADLKQYKEDYKAYKREILAVAFDVIKAQPELLNDKDAFDVNTSYRGDVQVTINRTLVTLPEEPVRPEEPNTKAYYGREYATKLDILERNLKVLKMTEQTEVNASTYSSVMELL